LYYEIDTTNIGSCDDDRFVLITNIIMKLLTKTQSMQRIIDTISNMVDPAVLISALFGGILAAGSMKGIPFWQRVLRVLTGMVLATFLAPSLCWAFNMNDSLIGGIGFIVGLFGMGTVDMIKNFFKNRIK